MKAFEPVDIKGAVRRHKDIAWRHLGHANESLNEAHEIDVTPFAAVNLTPRRKSAAIWSISLLLAVALHAAAAAALLTHWRNDSEAVAGMPAIIVDLAPVPAAPAIKQTDLPQGPQQDEAKAEPSPVKPAEKVALATPPSAQLLPVSSPAKTLEKPPEKPMEKAADKPKQQKRKHASLASAPAGTEHKSARTAAPAPGAAIPDSDALPGWKSQLVAALERNKGTSGEHGVVQLAFSVDRRGHVHHARILRSSGSSLLDKETMAMLERAAPLPPPPPEIAGAEIPIAVPIRYNMR